MRSPPSHDAAVSPAIGTILLVALTVVFVAVAAVVAMGLADGMFNMKQVGLTLTPYGISSEGERGISLTMYGGADAGDLVSLSAALNGPELVYSDGNSTVANPQVGQNYRFKAVESNVIVHTTRGNQNGIAVDLNTTEIKAVPATEYVVTVTGTFRDGTEQVLLIQKVTLPAIPKSGSASDATGYVSVSPYSISENYPGHGFIINVLDTSKYELVRDSAQFTFTSGHSGTLLVKKGLTRWDFKKDNKDDSTKASYDISTTAAGSPGGWDSTPYPNLDTYWALGELTGTVTVMVKEIGKDETKKEVTVQDIVIPKRVNIFENKSKYDGTISYDSKTEKLSYAPTVGSASPNTYYLLPSESQVTDNKPDFGDDSTDTIVEAYMKVNNVGGSNTNVWYRVGSAKISDLNP